MSNVVRLVSGGSIQVRTGVLQGIGPQGPRGVAGPQGQDGPQGPVGETGPMGQILKAGSRTDILSSVALSANTDTIVSFGSVKYDEINVIKSNTNFGFDNSGPGDYLLSCFVQFASNPGAGTRELWFQVVAGSLLVARATAYSSNAAAYLHLNFPFRAAGSEVINVMARSAQALFVTTGVMIITKIGSGPQGLVGPVGPAGAVGPIGPIGPQGPAGTANSGFTKYGDLLPH